MRNAGRLFWAAAGLGGVALLAPAVSAQEVDGLAVVAAIEQAIVAAVERAEPSIVSIARIKPPPAAPFVDARRGGFDMDDRPESLDFVPNDFGSGIIIGVDGPDKPNRRAQILTNYHVVKGGPVDGQAAADGTRLYVRLRDRRGYEARILAADPRSDFAVLVIDETDVQPIPFGDGGKLRKGSFVLTLGNPYAMARDGSPSVSWGMISNIGRRPELPEVPLSERTRRKDQTIHHLGNLLQVDSRLYLGTSGGALLNLKGELVGVTTALAALVGYEKSAGYAVPLDDAALRIIRTLQEGKEVEYGFLGVQLQQEPRVFGTPAVRHPGSLGVQIGRPIQNSPASRVLSDLDVIRAVNGKPIYVGADLTREIGKIAPGELVDLEVLRPRYTASIHLQVRLGKWPVVDEEGIIATRRHHEPWRGLVVDWPTARYRFMDDQMARYPVAVVVMEVLPGSKSEQAGLAKGQFISHVNGTPVSNPGEFYKAARPAQGTVTLTLIDQQQVRVQAGP